MKLPKIFNPKFIPILAILYGTLEIFAVKEYGSVIISAILWIIGGILIWRKSLWASIIIALFAIFEFIDDIIREIPKFNANVEWGISEYNSMGLDLSENWIAIIIIFTMSLQSLILFCFIYHGIYTIFRQDHD